MDFLEDYAMFYELWEVKISKVLKDVKGMIVLLIFQENMFLHIPPKRLQTVW